MNKYVILHNPHDKKSREFVLAHPALQVVEFYTETPSAELIEYCSKSLPHPSIFPCIVDTELKIKIDDAQSLESALEKIEILLNRDLALVSDAKNTRRDLLSSTAWIRERHSDELVNYGSTTLSAEQYQAWLSYWQALRDMDFSNPQNIVFPTQPTI